MLIPPMKEPTTYDDARFSEWVESMRKDVECTFGILKGRLWVLKIGVRVHGIATTDNIWFKCCALHNFLIEDGLNTEWDTAVQTE
jgi:Plant transposon protein